MSVGLLQFPKGAEICFICALICAISNCNENKLGAILWSKPIGAYVVDLLLLYNKYSDRSMELNFTPFPLKEIHNALGLTDGYERGGDTLILSKVFGASL